jgi:hypothetical protein
MLSGALAAKRLFARSSLKDWVPLSGLDCLLPPLGQPTKTRLQREIDTTDRQIDQVVYEFYGLTEEEIKIVEEATTQG